MRLDEFVDHPKYESLPTVGNRSVADLLRPDMLELVDYHWYKYPPMNPIWHGVIAIYLTVVAIISITGNTAVIYIFSTTKSLRTPSNMFVVNLAIADFCMMAFMTPPVVINSYNETWVLGPLMCELYGMGGSLFGCLSILSMTMIAVDRYTVIVKGIQRTPLTNCGAVVRIFFIWFISLLWTVFPMFGWNRYVPEGNMTACGTDYLSADWSTRSYVLVYSCVVYFSPLFTIIFCYYFILKTVSEHERSMREQAKKMNVTSLRSGDDARKTAEAKLAKVALVTISLWFMAWTPYLVINYCGIFEVLDLSPLATIWGSVFAKTNAVYNPIVYAISHPKYKAALKTKFSCLRLREAPVPDDNQTSVMSEEKNC